MAIYKAAIELFGENGYTATSMRDIAKKVGILPGSLYAHIDSKEALLLEIVESGIKRFLSIESNIAASLEPPEARMRSAIKAHMTAISENLKKYSVVFQQWRYLSGENRTRAVEMRRQYAQSFTNILTQGIESGDFRADLDMRVTVFSILGALNWTIEWYSATGTMTAEEVGDKMADTLLQGLRSDASVKKQTSKKRR